MSADKPRAGLIDPPWPFETYSRGLVVPTMGKQPYKPMKMYEIAGLPIPDLFHKDSALFMWVPGSLPRAAALLADVWGYRLVIDDVFVWQKPGRLGMGYWSRKESERVALLTRGRVKRKGKAVRQWLADNRREHSRKPDTIYERIEALVDGPYLEMFGRQQWPGWQTWGDQVGLFAAQLRLELGEEES